MDAVKQDIILIGGIGLAVLFFAPTISAYIAKQTTDTAGAAASTFVTEVPKQVGASIEAALPAGLRDSTPWTLVDFAPLLLLFAL